MRILLALIPDEFATKYKLKELAHSDGYVYIEIIGVM